jgi:phosphatidylinositol alpha-1,6-mannosyltransferase
MQSVLFLLPSLTSICGGIEQHARALVAAVARAFPDARLSAVLGREAQLVAPDQLPPELRGRLAIFGAGGRTQIERAARLSAQAGAAALQARPSLIVCEHLNYAPVGRVLATATGARLVVIAHGVEAWKIDSAAARFALRSADLVLAPSRYTAARVAAAAGLDAGRVELVANPVDTARFRPGPPSPAIEARLADCARPRLLTVARLDASEGYKGVDRVIEALASDRIDARYLIVGDGDDRARLEAMVKRLGVAARFWGAAREADLPELYRACDLFVMPSTGEGFGIVFAEAMASGLPAIGGADDGSAAVLTPLGRLVDPRRPDAIAAAIREQLAAPRDPARLHAEIESRFGLAAFEARVAALLSR